MKKILNKNTLFGIVIGIVIVGGISVLALDYLYKSEDVLYKKSDNTEVSVKTALEELYDLSKHSKPLLGATVSSSNNTVTKLSAFYIDSNSLQNNSNVFTFNQEGTYTIGYYSWGNLYNSYYSTLYIYINNSLIKSVPCNTGQPITGQLEISVKSGDTLYADAHTNYVSTGVASAGSIIIY